MPNYNVELLSPAWDDLDAIADYHMLEIGADSAKKVTEKILLALERLRTFPKTKRKSAVKSVLQSIFTSLSNFVNFRRLSRILKRWKKKQKDYWRRCLEYERIFIQTKI